MLEILKLKKQTTLIGLSFLSLHECSINEVYARSGELYDFNDQSE